MYDVRIYSWNGCCVCGKIKHLGRICASPRPIERHFATMCYGILSVQEWYADKTFHSVCRLRIHWVNMQSIWLQLTTLSLFLILLQYSRSAEKPARSRQSSWDQKYLLPTYSMWPRLVLSAASSLSSANLFVDVFFSPNADKRSNWVRQRVSLVATSPRPSLTNLLSKNLCIFPYK